MYDGEFSPEGAEQQGSLFRTLPIKNGKAVFVLADLHPFLSEWTWVFDPILRQAVRHENGLQKTLYEEELRMLHRVPEDRPTPILERSALRAKLGDSPAYLPLLRRIYRQQEIAERELAMAFPDAVEFLSYALSQSLLRYFSWRVEGTRWRFLRDPDGLTPGKLVERLSVHPDFELLGQWLRTECTGDWIPHAESATGLAPETYFSVAMEDARDVWCNLTEAVNVREVDCEEAWGRMTELDLSLDGTMHLATEVIASYRLT